MRAHPGMLLAVSSPVISVVVVDLNLLPSSVNTATETSALRELHDKPDY